MLKVDSLSVRYGSIQALKGVSLEIREGEIVTIIGPNGAGKTTLLRAVSGFKRPESGSVRLRERDITRAEPFAIVQQGVTHVLQGRQIFNDLSVLQNLKLGAYHRRGVAPAQLQADLEEVFGYFPLLRERLRQKGGTLSGGEQVMLAVGRALMSRPRLLLLDEPSLGLAPKIVDVVFETLQQLNRKGYTVVLVEQNAELAFDLADRCYLMELGRVALEGRVDEVRHLEKVVDLYLGKSAAGAPDEPGVHGTQHD